MQWGVIPSLSGSLPIYPGDGSLDPGQTIDSLTERYSKSFYLHYNFPGYSTGEPRPNRGPGRREVGHGNLAERAIKTVLPARSAGTTTFTAIRSG